MKKLTALFLCFCLTCGCFSGCAREEEEPYVPTGDAILLEGQDPEDFIVEEESDPVTLAYNPEMSMNPLIAHSPNNRVLFSLMYQSLFVTDQNYEVKPILCQRYRVSEDLKTYTIYPETNARFSDGDPLQGCTPSSTQVVMELGFRVASKPFRVTSAVPMSAHCSPSCMLPEVRKPRA